jgi:hypothetical protein
MSHRWRAEVDAIDLDGTVRYGGGRLHKRDLAQSRLGGAMIEGCNHRTPRLREAFAIL